MFKKSALIASLFAASVGSLAYAAQSYSERDFNSIREARAQQEASGTAYDESAKPSYRVEGIGGSAGSDKSTLGTPGKRADTGFNVERNKRAMQEAAGYAYQGE